MPIDEPIIPVPEPAPTLIQHPTEGGADSGAKHRLKAKQLLAMSAYWLGTNLHWGALMLILIPGQIGQMAPATKALWLSRILAVGSLIALIMPPIVGALSDRCVSRWGRRRPYIAGGVLVNVLGLVILCGAGWLGSLWLYFLGYLVVQLGNNSASGAYNGVIPDLVPEEQFGEASGYMAGMTQVGTIVGAVGAGLLFGKHHNILAFLAIVAALIITLAVTLVGVREQPLREAPEPINWRRFLGSLWVNPREHPDFAWVWLTRAFVTLGMSTIQPFIQYYLSDVIHVRNPAKMAGLLLGAILLGGGVTGVIGGLVADRVGARRIVYAANTFIAIVSIGFLFAHTLPVAFTIGVFYGLGYGAYYSVDWSLGCQVLPNKEEAAKYMGVWHIAMVLPQSIGALIGGLTLNFAGQTPDHHYHFAGYAALFSLAAVFLLLGAVLLRNVRGIR